MSGWSRETIDDMHAAVAKQGIRAMTTITNLSAAVEGLREIVGRMTPGKWHACFAENALYTDDHPTCLTEGDNAVDDLAGIVALRNTALPIIDAQAAEIAEATRDEPCPLCSGIVREGWHCMAGCRDGVVRSSTANVLRNVKPFLDGHATQAAEIVVLKAELDEQARVNGVGGEREAALIAERDRLLRMLECISDLFSDAVQADCENGVASLNARAAKAYLKDAPETLAAIRKTQEIVDAAFKGGNHE